MQLIGDPHTFAMELNLREAGEYVFASAFLWINNQKLGTDEECVAYTLRMDLEKFFAEDPVRQRADLYAIPDEAVLAYIEESLENEGREEQTRSLCLLRYGPEPFDGWEIVVIENAGNTRFIWRAVDDPKSVRSAIIQSKTFVDVLKRAIAAIPR
jgi:hypothetical protein